MAARSAKPTMSVLAPGIKSAKAATSRAIRISQLSWPAKEIAENIRLFCASTESFRILFRLLKNLYLCY